MSANIRKSCCSYHPDAALLDDYHAGDVVCSVCGLVVGDRVIDVGSEWRSFSDDAGSKDNSRVGQGENELYGNDLSTCIQQTKGAGSIFHGKHSGGIAKGLENAYKEIAQIAVRLNLTDAVRDDAKLIFKSLYEAKITKKKGCEALSAASIFMACRRKGIPRSSKEMCAVSNVSKKDLNRAYLVIKNGLRTPVEVVTSEDFISRFCSLLRIPKHIENAAKYISNKLGSINELVSRSPTTLAAASIYMTDLAGDCSQTISQIAENTGVAEATIRTSYRIMLPYADTLFPENFNFVRPIARLPKS